MCLQLLSVAFAVVALPSLGLLHDFVKALSIDNEHSKYVRDFRHYSYQVRDIS